MNENDEKFIDKLKKMIEEAENNNTESDNIPVKEEKESKPSLLDYFTKDEPNVIENDDDSEESQEEFLSDKKDKNAFPWKAVFASLITCLGVLIVILLILFVPIQKKSLFKRLVNYYSETKIIYYEPKNSNKEISGQEIPADSNIDIIVETRSIASAVFAKSAKSVVGIRVTQTTGQFWERQTSTVCEGSGVIYTEDGYIITNHHIIESTLTSNGKIGNEYNVQVFLDESLSEYFDATLIGFDETSDLALLRIEAAGLSPIVFADSDKVAPGDLTVAIGSPGGIEYMNSVTTGIVSGISRAISSGSANNYDMIQTDAAINPGNSGGALLNENGELIGICELKLVSSGYENMGFAISSNTVADIIGQLKNEGSVTRTKLGVTIYTSYNKTIADENGYPEGCLVNDVEENSCAYNAGIKADDIIIAINDMKVGDFYALRKILLSYKPGDTVTITVFRYSTGETLDLTVILDKA